MSYRYYLKKLTSNELGYRKGKFTTGQFFYISKQASEFFPPLSSAKNNDTVILLFNVEYSNYPVSVNLVYHNDKYNRERGTRDEFRIYLNREIAPDDFFFRPDDIIIMERVNEKLYNLKKYRKENTEYEHLNLLLSKSKMRGQHLLCNGIA